MAERQVFLSLTSPSRPISDIHDFEFVALKPPVENPRSHPQEGVLSLPIPLRVLLAAQPELVTPVLQVVQRVVRRHLLDDAGLRADEG